MRCSAWTLLGCFCLRVCCEGQVPLFLRPGEPRLLRRKDISGFSDLLGPDVDVTALRELLLRTRDAVVKKDCGSCAVVGAAGTLIKDEAGAEIDQHECVFRINNAPLKTFHHFAGYKRTFQVIGLPTTPGLMGEIGLLKKVQRSLVDFASQATNLSIVLLLDVEGTQQVLDFVRSGELPASRTKVLHPFQLQTFCEDPDYGGCQMHRPSTGLLTIRIAQQLCRSAPTVFGFDANSIPFHYYDLPNEHVCDAIRGDRFRGQGIAHQWEVEQARLRRWHRDGQIKLFQPSGDFSPVPDTSMCEKAHVEIQVETQLNEIRGNYYAQVYTVNGKPVYERPPAPDHDYNIMLYFAICALQSGATGAWVFSPHTVLADALKRTPGVAMGCNAMAISEDFRPEQPEKSTWKVAAGPQGMVEVDFVMEGLEAQDSSMEEYVAARRSNKEAVKRR